MGVVSMKVLQRGRKPEEWSRVLPCTGNGYEGVGCEALLLVEAVDLFLVRGDDAASPFRVAFECPECGVWTAVTSVPPCEVKRTRVYLPRGG